MRMPILRVPGNRSEEYTVAFRGINYGEGAADGQLEDSRNVTAERFPCLSPRKGRTAENGYDNVTAVYYKNGLFVVAGTDLLYEGEVIATVTPGEKQFAAINTKVVIYPDKILFDTDTGEVRTLGAVFVGDAGMVEIVDGKTMAVHQGAYTAVSVATGNVGGTGGKYMTINRTNTAFTVHESAYVNSETGEIVIADGTEDTAKNIDVGTIFTKAVMTDGTVLLDLDATKQYAIVTKRYYYHISGITPANPTEEELASGTSSASTDEGSTYATSVYLYGFDYEIIGASGENYGTYKTLEDMGFREGDTIELEGFTTFPDYNGSYNIRAISTHTQEDGTEVQTLVFDADLFPEIGAEAGAVTIRRKTPELTVVCESNNRLWGAEGHTIYASALGDPTNFYTYDGLDTDSYAVAVASEGDFTGCCGFGNSVLFWKEDRLHKILGAYPSQYTMYEYNVPGVKKGSEGSLVNINEVLYYHGRDGVYRYSGGAPDLASEVFGLRRFEEASAGAIEGRYYISMKDRQSGEWGLWVYDTLRGLWVQEDETHAQGFDVNDGKLYMIAGGELLCINPDESDETVEWSATTCRMDETYHNRKCYSRVNIRADVAEGSWLMVEISHDGGPFSQVYLSHNTKDTTLDIPIHPRRCDCFRIRLSGEGGVIVRSMVRMFRVESMYR